MPKRNQLPIHKFQESVLVDLKYIRMMVKKNESQLEKINGRVRDAEKSIEMIKGIGSMAGIVFSGFIAWVFKTK
jgi:hypothetical protein|tara:strand:- start:9029 stop:9250 length:222 start_codon:yes stop_codon:yes gene_type:complete